MDKNETEENIVKINEYKDKVHVVLAHSYAVYFSLFLAGVLFDLIFNLRILSFPLMTPAGIILILSATLLIFWAQKTSRNLKKETITKETFMKGPYRYSRGPTHWGLFFLMLGFGLLNGAIFIVIFTFISLLVTKFTYLRKEETILEKKYGAPYLEYKKEVKL